MEDREYREYVIYADERRFEYHIEKGLEPETDLEWYDFIYYNAIDDKEKKILFNSKYIRIYAILPSNSDGLLITEFNTNEFLKKEGIQGNTEEHHEEGIKYDDSKPRVAEFIIDFEDAILATTKAWEFGVKKYGKSNWKQLKDGTIRYTNALLRHLLKEPHNLYDEETNLLHATHIAFNALARLHFILEEEKKKKKRWLI